MVEIDILKILLTPDNLSIFLYYFIPGYLFFAFIRFKEFFGLREKWKVITGLDMIIFSIIVSIAFSLNFMLIFYAIINYYAVIILDNINLEKIVMGNAGFIVDCVKNLFGNQRKIESGGSA